MTTDLTQHITIWKAFNTHIYRKTLTSEHLVGNGGERFIDTVYKVTSQGQGVYQVEEDIAVNQKCLNIDKGGIKYLLPSLYKKDLPLNPAGGYECYLKKSDKTIYHLITKRDSVRITPEKTMSFKDLVSVWNLVPHTHPKTWDFLKIQAISAKAKGGKYRLCSPPETGKNVNDSILHLITNDNVRVAHPTLAKLETLFYYNQKVLPDEMTSLTPQNVREVEPFFLCLADETPSFTKHSMAQNKDLNEVDITRSSCIFTYNDKDSIQPGNKFFDEIWQNPKAFNSRYPALLLEGKVVSDFPKMSMPEAEKIMLENFIKLRILSKNLVYYIHNLHKEQHGWLRDRLKMKGRHRVNFECVMDGLDAWSDSQAEFDAWIDFVNDALAKYRDMIKKGLVLDAY